MVSLSDVLIAVTDNNSLYNVTNRMSEAGFPPNENGEFYSVFVHIRLKWETAVCAQ